MSRPRAILDGDHFPLEQPGRGPLGCGATLAWASGQEVPRVSDSGVLITIDSDEASDSWGFVGTVHIGAFEAYRTIRAYTTPGEAREAAQQLLAEVLGSLMAGQEWRTASEAFGHAARRSELGLGLRRSVAQPQQAPEPHEPGRPADR